MNGIWQDGKFVLASTLESKILERDEERDELVAEIERLRAADHLRATSGIPHDALCFFKDGNKWCCVFGDFTNLQESPAGFGDSFDEALENLHEVLENLQSEGAV